MLPGAWMRVRIVRESGMDTYTLLCLIWVTNKDLLYSTENSAQCYVPAWMGGEFGGKQMKSVLVTQSCPTLRDTMDCIPTRPLCPQDSPGKNTSHFLLQGIFLTQGSNWGLLHCRQILYQLSYQGRLSAISLTKQGSLISLINEPAVSFRATVTWKLGFNILLFF